MKTRILTVIVCVMAVVNVALADTIRGINIDFVTIGNAGNAADFDGDGWYGYPSASGAVGYNYRIGKYEITNVQWNAFTAAAGAPTGNPGYAYDQDGAWPGDQKPKAWVSWYEAAQFCNWLTSGDKSLGAYQLGTDGSITVNRDAAVSTYGIIYVLPTEDEWYKAAYYKPDGSGYSLYANGTNIAPSTSQARYGNSSPWNVGSGAQEQNGTYDMMGNVWEWNETKIYDSYPWRGVRGGMFSSTDPVWDLSSYRINATEPEGESNGQGFRIASIPEPAIEATVEINPNTLNLQSNGKWITCYIWLPEDYNVVDINSASVVLHDTIKAEWTMIEEEAQVLMAKFSRSAVEDILQPGTVELTVSGKLNDGTRFKGKNTITVINKGKP